MNKIKGQLGEGRLVKLVWVTKSGVTKTGRQFYYGEWFVQGVSKK